MYDLLDKIIPYIFTFSFLAMLLCVVQVIRRMRSKVKEVTDGKVRYARPYPFVSMALFMGSLLSIFAASKAIKHEAHKEIDDWIAHVDKPSLAVEINGQPNRATIYVLDAITYKGAVPTQHIGPTGNLTVTLHDKNGRLDLLLGRNPAVKDEYWVLYPRYKSTTNNEVYRIRTNMFARYWP